MVRDNANNSHQISVPYITLRLKLNTDIYYIILYVIRKIMLHDSHRLLIETVLNLASFKGEETRSCVLTYLQCATVVSERDNRATTQ